MAHLSFAPLGERLNSQLKLSLAGLQGHRDTCPCKHDDMCSLDNENDECKRSIFNRVWHLPTPLVDTAPLVLPVNVRAAYVGLAGTN